jgi:aryl-alcohol dehydrogenase-like predicted oxidoreductase
MANLMSINRRSFIERSALGLGALVIGNSVAPAAETKPATFDPYEKVRLGNTGLNPSRFCLGTGVRGGNRESNHTRMGKEKFEALIKSAHERGIRMFDLADLYGTHPYVVPALSGIPRDSYQVVSKIWYKPGGIPEKERPDADVVVARFLKETRTDYLDLVLLHCVTEPEWPTLLRKQMDLLSKLKEKGVVRSLGVSCHSLAALEAAAKEPWVESVHARINPFQMSMDGPPDQVVTVLKKIHDAGKGVVGMKIIGEGRLRNDDAKRNESAKFVLGLGCVDVLNIGFEKTEEIDDFAERVKRVPRTA